MNFPSLSIRGFTINWIISYISALFAPIVEQYVTSSGSRDLKLPAALVRLINNRVSLLYLNFLNIIFLLQFKSIQMPISPKTIL
jgi:hypothetical protein